jgi:sulfur relay (sulfurtransferase) DsrC/TusE family protein
VQPFSDQRLLLHEITNHAEFKQKLTKLKLTNDFATFDAAVVDVVASWFKLAKEHSVEMAKLDVDQLPRAAYSRAYYAAYNASKAVRYMSRGVVSLHGDDHRKIADLPDTFPNVNMWARELQVMYQHRLRADYDNWTQTPSEHTLKPRECTELARKFLETCETFLKDVYKVTV